MSLSNLVGQVLDEKYQIEKQLGKGGMGTVYLATHLGTDRPVALKVIVPQFMLNDEFVERFKREAKAAGRMRHPNVVDVTDFGFASLGGNRVAYLVMEYLDGCSLAEVLAEESRLPIDWIVDILEQACSAVDEAHRAGTIHRDLKPDNIWLEPNRRGGYTVKVLDFGLAKHGETASIDEPASIESESNLASCRITRAIAKAPALAHKTEMLEGATRAISRDAGEAATQNSAAPVVEEENTLILDQQATVAEPGELDTQLLPPEEAETETLALPSTPVTNETNRNTNEASHAQATASAEGLTRVGSILGTPLYMSPEQCRGEQLDARSDIYSLGVIAYQMLTGEPPFKGDLHEVMRQHMETPPPPLREKRKKVPRRMAQIVMSALAKSPSERPASATTFASAFRASSEGTGKLLRRALALYSEHFPLFFRLGLMAYMPVFFILAGIFLSKNVLPKFVSSAVVVKTITILLGIGLYFANFLATVVITGVTIWLVVQLYAAPLRPLRLRSALRSMKKRLKPFALTTMRVVFFSLLLFPLLIVPSAIYFINASLAAPAVIIENLKGRAAVRRSKALVKHARLTVIAILILEWAIPAFMSSIVLRALGMNPKAEAGVGFSLRFNEWIGTLLNVIFIPLVAMLTALLYLKVRQLSGERLKDMLDQFEQEEVPRSNWQKRMRERLSSSSHSTRSA